MADTQRDVGRPPLKPDQATKSTTVRLTVDVMDRIIALVGPNRMAEFIRTAITRELDRRAQPGEPKDKA